MYAEHVYNLIVRYRNIFLKKNVVPEFGLLANESLKLIEPLYGLSESRDHWFQTFDKHHEVELGMTTLWSRPALYYAASWQEVISGSAKTNQGSIELVEKRDTSCPFTVISIDQEKTELSYFINWPTRKRWHCCLKTLLLVKLVLCEWSWLGLLTAARTIFLEFQNLLNTQKQLLRKAVAKSSWELKF